MSIVDPNSLRPGSRLSRSLFTRQGVKVLSAGVVLSEEMCSTLQNARWGDLYFADTAGELRDNRVLHDASQAPAGARAEQDLVTIGGVLAVEAGQTVEPHHAAAYELGALAGPATREDQRQRAARMKVADEYVAALAASWSTLPTTIEPASVPPPDPARPVRAWPDPAGLAAFRAERIRRFGRLFARILSGLPVPMRQVDTLVDELVELNRAHPERFTQLALLAPAPREYLAEHGYTTACLSVAIAARLRWAPEHIRLAGASGLLADVGMGLVPFELRASARPLDDLEINRVRRHPAFSVVLLEAVEGLPQEVRQAAYQHHERENGSGYPAGLRGRKISDLARVVSVADAFAAATSMRRYRSPKRPYDAAEEMIMLGSSGLFPRRIVRALVEAVGLFPVGSHVRLSNGSPAVVVGSHPDMIDRPIICTLENMPGGYRMGMAVDLAEYKPWELSVIQAIDAPAAAAEAVLRQSA